MTILTLILALLRIAPIVLEMIRDGRIREATTQEVLRAFEAEFNARWEARVQAARNAGVDGNAGGSDSGGGVPNTSEGNDPLDRASKRKGTGK